MSSVKVWQLTTIIIAIIALATINYQSWEAHQFEQTCNDKIVEVTTLACEQPTQICPQQKPDYPNINWRTGAWKYGR